MFNTKYIVLQIYHLIQLSSNINIVLFIVHHYLKYLAMKIFFCKMFPKLSFTRWREERLWCLYIIIIDN